MGWNMVLILLVANDNKQKSAEKCIKTTLFST